MKQDHQFEQSFSDLAYSALQNSYPDLLEKSVGFQLVDSNDENTKALGIFAIKLGGKHYYIPAFFVSGRLKPLELIYDKEEDRFLPLERDWLDLIMKPDMMDMGLSSKMPRIGMSNPNLEIYANPPRTGRVVTSSADTRPGAELIDTMIHKEASEETKPFLLFLAMAPKLVKRAFLGLCKDCPDYLEKLLNFHNWDMVKEACLTNPSRYYKQDTGEDFAIIEDVLDKRATPEISRKVLEDGIFVLDKRAGMASDAYFTDAIIKFESVTDTGFYKIPDSQGEVRNYFVAQKTCDEDQNKWRNEVVSPHGKMPYNRNKPKICIIDMKEGKYYEPCFTVMGQRNHDEKYLMDTILKALKPASECEPDKEYCFILRQGDGFRTAGCFKVREVSERDGCTQLLAKRCGEYSRHCYKLLIRPGTGSIGRPRDDVITMTSDVKAIPLEGGYGYDADAKFGCQSPKVMEAAAMQQGVYKMSAATDGVDYLLEAPGYSQSGLSKKAALFQLCRAHGMKGEDAIKLLKLAEDSESRKSSCFIKKAVSPYHNPPVYSGPQYAPMPIAQMTDPQYQGGKYWPEQWFNEEWSLPTPQGPRDGYRVDIGPENMFEQPDQMSSVDQTMAMGAAQTGDKDVMEAGTIASMAAFSDIDDLIDTYLPDLMKAMDKVGRMIFMYWYKTDKFADKYSSTEIKETEDMLRNLFKELGKTIYKFKTNKSDVHSMIETR